MNINDIDTKLISIKIDDIKVDPEKYNPEKSELVSTRFRLATGAKSLDHNVLFARIDIIIEQEGKTLTSLLLTGLFDIEKRGWKQFIHKDSLIFPKFLLARVYSMLYSTARGVILMRNNNNKLNTITLPLIDSNDLVEEDHIINMDDSTNEIIEYS